MYLSFSYYCVRNILLTYGLDVMETEEFRSAFFQEHHYTTTVGDHSVNVAVISIMICILLAKINVRVDMQAVVRAALCHDLGILGREAKYRNEFECCWRHPLDSVLVAKAILPDCDDHTLQCIETHMWPARPGRPRSLEGHIVSLADKYAAVMECTHRASVYHCRNIIFRYVTV